MGTMDTKPDDAPSGGADIPLRIHLDPAALKRKLTRELTLTYQRTALGLRAADQASLAHAYIDEAFAHLGWSDHDKPDGAQVQGDFRTWVLSCGFRDIVEAMGLFLDKVYQSFLALGIGQLPRVLNGELSAFRKKRERFHRGGIPDKIKELRKAGFVDLCDPLVASIESLNAARNCFVHRGGVVGPKDLDTTGVLTVHWKRHRLVLRRCDEEHEAIGSLTEEGDEIALRTEIARREFSLGDRLVFSPEEFSQVTFMVAAELVQPVMVAVVDRLKSAGVFGTDGTLVNSSRYHPNDS